MRNSTRAAAKIVRLLPRRARTALARLLFAAEAVASPRAALRGLLALANDLEGRVSEVASGYDDGLHPKHRLLAYHDFFVARLTHGERVLDVGCGTGALAHSLAERAGAVVTAVDKDAPVLARARERFLHPRITYVDGDAAAMVFAEPFDAIVMSNVLEHLEGRVELLRRLQHQCQPRRFLIRVPMMDRDWTVPMKRELGLPHLSDAAHMTEYTEDSFRREIEAAGLVITHATIRWGEIWAEARHA